MSNRLKAIINRIEGWPKQAQEDALNSLRAIEQDYLGGDDLTPEDCEALSRSAEDVRLGRFANDEDVQEAFARYRRG
jgi:hypothetical protein